MLSTAVIARVFEGPARPIIPLDLAAEGVLIARAKAGDDRAYEALLDAYAPGLRKAVQREYRQVRESGIGVDEVRSLVLLGFVEAVMTCEGERLAGNLRPAITRTVADALPAPTAVSVPTRTYRRFVAVMEAAEGDWARAEELAPTFELSVEALRAIRDARGMWSSLDELATDDDGSPRDVAAEAISVERGYASVEQRAMCTAAFAAIRDDERATGVVRDAYGFSDYEPIPDAEIAHRRGMSRSAVQRVRTGAIGRMRDALGVEVEAD